MTPPTDLPTTEARQRPLASIKRILVATDLSARSDRAIERAMLLARAHAAALTVAHVADEDMPIIVHEQVVTAARQQIDACLAHGRDGLDIDVRILMGKDYRDIIMLSDAIAADLLVLGIHGHDFDDRPFSGTTMERIIRHGQRPVLVVSQRAAGPYARTLAAVDFSIVSRLAVASALGLAPTAKLHVVHAYDVPFSHFLGNETNTAHVRKSHERDLHRFIAEELARTVAAEAGATGPQQTPVMIARRGTVSAVIRDECKRLSPDLLVLGTHGRVGIARAMLGSVAEEFLNRPPCDVLAVKAW